MVDVGLCLVAVPHGDEGVRERLLGVVQQYAASLLGSEWLKAAAFIILVLILLFRPTGLLGESLGRARA